MKTNEKTNELKQQPARHVTVKTWIALNQASGNWPATQASARYLIFHADSNGFAKCIRRIGRRVLIDLDAVPLWLESEYNAEGRVTK